MVKEYLNNTPNAKEGTDGQKCPRLNRIGIQVFEIWFREQFSKLILSACNFKL